MSQGSEVRGWRSEEKRLRTKVTRHYALSTGHLRHLGFRISECGFKSKESGFKIQNTREYDQSRIPPMTASTTSSFQPRAVSQILPIIPTFRFDPMPYATPNPQFGFRNPKLLSVVCRLGFASSLERSAPPTSDPMPYAL